VLDDADALGAIAYQLQHRDLHGWTAAGEAEFTESKREMIEVTATDIQQWMIGERESPLFACGVVNLNALIEAIPAQFKSRVRNVTATVRDVLKRRFYAQPYPHAVQIGFRKSDQGRVWIVGDSAEQVARRLKRPWNEISDRYRAARGDGDDPTEF